VDMDISMISTENLWIWMGNFISTARLKIYYISYSISYFNRDF